MRKGSKKKVSGALILFILACMSLFMLSNAWGQTFISGKVITADGKIVASGAVALEKGELHNDAFLAGGAIGPRNTPSVLFLKSAEPPAIECPFAPKLLPR